MIFLLSLVWVEIRIFSEDTILVHLPGEALKKFKITLDEGDTLKGEEIYREFEKARMGREFLTIQAKDKRMVFVKKDEKDVVKRGTPPRHVKIEITGEENLEIKWPLEFIPFLSFIPGFDGEENLKESLNKVKGAFELIRISSQKERIVVKLE